jgi:hypothetical protein
MLSILVLDFPQKCLIQQCVHTCLVCLSPIADPDHLPDLMSDTASAAHHADLPVLATLSPRRPLGDIASECVEAVVGGDACRFSRPSPGCEISTAVAPFSSKVVPFQ